MAELEQEFLDVFIEEVDDILSRLENDLIDLEKNKKDPELINKVFRSFHTIKGSGGLVGFQELSEYTHGLEAILDQIRNGQTELTSEIMGRFLTSVDKIKEYIEGVKKGEVPDASFFGGQTSRRESVSEPLEQKSEISSRVGAEKEVKKESIESSSFFFYDIHLGFADNLVQMGHNPFLLLKELEEIGDLDWVTLDAGEVPDFRTADFSKFFLKWRLLFKTRASREDVEDVFVFVMDERFVKIEQIDEDQYDEILFSFQSESESLGTIEIQDGQISDQDLEEALKKNEKLGDLLLESGYIDQAALDRAMARKGSGKKEKEKSFIRVNTEKLDTLLNLVSELIISHSRIYSIVNQLSVYSENTMEINNVVTGLENLTRDIQEQVMSIRMIPLGPTFVQFNRLVRDLTQKQNKKIEFKILGSETELDKNMIEKISDPLKHMVRNAIDHGLETPEERKNKGKTETGTLILEAYYKEGNVVIEIRDDGRGLDKTRILAKAVERGLVSADENLSEQKIFQMIFLPGFSTADQVTDISGRGVGMDVVRQNIESLRGKIDIFSTEGQGTTFRILLPLTMAIIDGMLVTVNQTYYVVPLLSIVESFKPEENIISSVEGNVEVIEYREEYIPLIRMTEALYRSGEKKSLSDSILIIVESNGKKYGLQADELIGQQQIVVKSLETNYRNVSGLSGATILGDGKVALILDIEGIVKNIMHQKERSR